MNPDKLKQAIAIATEATQHIEDKEIRIKSYEVILNNLLRRESDAKIAKSISAPSNKLNENSYEVMASALNVKSDLVRDFVEIGEDIRILHKIKRYNSIEEHALFLIIYLSARKKCYGTDEIDSGKLREVLATHQIQNINNLSKNVKKISRFVIHKSGKIGSTKTSYRITHEGVSYGLDCLKQIIEGTDPSKLDLNFFGIKSISRSKNSSKVGSEINKLFEEGFFDSPKSSKEVVAEVRKRGFFNKRQDIDAYLRQVLLGKKLIRDKTKGKWHYVKKK